MLKKSNKRNVAKNANQLLLKSMYRHGPALAKQFRADKVNDGVMVTATEIKFKDKKMEAAFKQLIDQDNYNA